MRKLDSSATDADVLGWAHAWIKLVASQGFEAGLELLEQVPNGVPWSQALLGELTFDHFDDGKQPRITDPDQVRGLRMDVYRHKDGAGFSVEHDLAMDGKRSDFTAILSFRRTPDGYLVSLKDVHVL